MVGVVPIESDSSRGNLFFIEAGEFEDWHALIEGSTMESR